MDLSKSVFVRFDLKSRRESGPYEVSALASYQLGPDSIARFDGEEVWRPAHEIVEAYENSSASEVQRQRLRKQGVVFDELRITRREARELYRNTPAQKAKQAARDVAREERDRRERIEALTEVRNAGFNVPDDIELTELETLRWAQPPEAKLEKTLKARVAEVAADGFEISVPKYPTKDGVESLLEIAVEFIETSRQLEEGFRYEVDTGCLNREPTSEEISAMRKLFLATLLKGEWDGTIQSLAKMLCSVSPGMLYTADGNCTAIPSPTESSLTLRIWARDGYSYHSVVVSHALGQAAAICDCTAGKMKRLCRHVKAVIARDADALWDKKQGELLAKASGWLISTGGPEL